MMSSSLLKTIQSIHQVIYILSPKSERNAKGSHDNQVVQSDCTKQLIALLLKDHKNSFVFLKTKIIIDLGGVLHPVSPKKE